MINTINTIKLSDSDGKVSINKTLPVEVREAEVSKAMAIKTKSNEIVFGTDSPPLITLEYLEEQGYNVNKINVLFREVTTTLGLAF